MDINEYFERVSELDKKISYSFYDNYKDFEYSNKRTFEIDVNFLTKNVYDITIEEPSEEKNKRIGQKEFRDELIKKYGSCIISKTHEEECHACHIIPHSENINYDIDNGLLLSIQLHNLYDRYYWAINPYTKKVEVSGSAKEKNLTCCKYENDIVDISMNSVILFNLTKKYNDYLKNNK
jgi:hypothetical protein